MWPMVSKFSGKCRKCGGHIRTGDNIVWSRGTGAMHPECAEPDPDEEHEGVVCSECETPVDGERFMEIKDRVWCMACWEVEEKR